MEMGKLKIALGFALAVGSIGVAMADAASKYEISAQGEPPAAKHQVDGGVTKAIAVEKAAARFDAMDANKDGKVTTDERTAWRKAHVGKHDGGANSTSGDGGPGGLSTNH